jgi:hypothetical protein
VAANGIRAHLPPAEFLEMEVVMPTIDRRP